MGHRIRKSTRRAASILIAALAMGTAGVSTPASAQGFFESLFGSFRHPPMPARSNAFADPSGPFDSYGRRASADNAGRGTVYCVRTCDGRYFPLQRHAGMSPAETCHAFCPTATTMVFSGSKIDTAVAQNGTRYADLDNAFAYRDHVVNNCTCNGKDRLGLARVDAAADPTLRPGDIVATNDGLATYNGGGPDKTSEFTPINASASEWARRLAEVKVAPPPSPDASEPADDDISTMSLRKRRAEAAH